jgi:hypothetical protein
LETRALLAGDVCVPSGDVDVSDAGLQLRVPDQFIPGIPFLVRVQYVASDGLVDRSRWNDTVQLRTGDSSVELSSEFVTLYNGMGSVLTTVNTSETFTLSASLGACTVQDSLTPQTNTVPHAVAGTLAGSESQWSGVVHVTGDVLIPVGHTLTIAPGTIILVDGAPQAPQLEQGKHLRVQGRMIANGTETEPITITASDPGQPWGELHVDGGEVSLNHTSLTRAGSSPRGGHTNTGPALRLTNSGRLTLLDSNVTDISGKIMESTAGALVMHDTLLSRAVMGPEINNTSLDFRDSWIVDMAGRFHHNGTVDDNDGIYLHSQRAGQEITLSRSVIAQVQDDSVDTLESVVLLRDVIIRDATDKLISVFHGETTVEHSLLVHADIGIETKGAGTSTAKTNVLNSTIANVRHAIRAFDKGDASPNVQIDYDIRNSILHVIPGGDPLFTDYDPADLRFNYGWAAEAWEHPGSGDGNLVGEPQFRNAAMNDYRLLPNSPAIDAGDPASPPDPDGSRTDLGYLPFVTRPAGDFNADSRVNATDIDLLCAALAAANRDPVFDVNQDGAVTTSDYDFLIRDVLGTTRGDANLDGVFNSRDLVLIFQAGQYEDAAIGNSGWATGDWNCDGDFTTADLVAAFQAGGYQA